MSQRQPVDENSAPASSGGRSARSDARRNRDRLVEAARRALSDGAGTLSLEAVARAAGVGIGTLYRNFAGREQLLDAVYAAEIDALIASASEAVDHLPPRDALHAWLLQFAAFAATKRGMVEALGPEAVTAAKPRDYVGTVDKIAAAMAPLLRAGAQDGSLRADVHPHDVVILVAGALMPLRTDAAQTDRLLGLVLDALRPEVDGLQRQADP